MPPIIDLTLPLDAQQRGQETLHTEVWQLKPAGRPPYQARVHYFNHNSMAGTYLDFPSHIVHTDDGSDAANFPAEKLFRLDATVIHLARTDGSGAILAAELEATCPPGPAGSALVLNALGSLRFDQIAERSVYLAAEAVQWIIERGFRLLVADVFESNEHPQGVFDTLFAAGVLTVCQPIRLDELTSPRIKLTVLPLRVAGATQIPCRVMAEVESVEK
jgi:kynurenine formamidase